MIKTKPAQIMVITMVTLLVLGTITVGIVTNTRRDVAQTVATTEYETLYNHSEESIFKIVDKYGKVATNGELVALADLPTSLNGVADCNLQSVGKYRCIFNNTTTATTQLDVADVTSFTDLELNKDLGISIKLSGFRGEVRISWEGNAALDMGLLYHDNAGRFKAIRDVFDRQSILTTNGGDPFSDPSNNHAFPFQSHLDPNNSFRFNIGNVSGLNGSDVTELLTITPRMSGASGSIIMDFTADAGLIPQMRELVAATYNGQSNTAPVATAKTLIPLYPQDYNVFDYGLLVNGPVNK